MAAVLVRLLLAEPIGPARPTQLDEPWPAHSHLRQSSDAADEALVRLALAVGVGHARLCGVVEPPRQLCRTGQATASRAAGGS